MSTINVENIVKQYGKGETGVTAIAGMEFSIASGEFVAVMGESGSGKSTLLSVLGGLNSPTSGRLTIDGIDVYSLDPDGQADFRRNFIGFVFQNFNLIPYLTLAENVMVPLATGRESKRTKRSMAEDVLEKVGLKGKASRLPGQVSGGEQERVAIARAIINKPPILLADEPTGNLDSKTGGEIMGLIRGLNSEGMTIVMVTHSREYASAAGRILHVADGALVAEVRD